MKSRVTPGFWKLFDELDRADQAPARQAFALFQSDPGHPSLRFKKLAGCEDVWSVRVTLNIRAVGVRRADAMTWIWIGSHARFDRQFG